MSEAAIAQVAREYPSAWHTSTDYDPSDHLMNLKGREYLNVQGRLRWFIADQRMLIMRGMAVMPFVVRTEIVEMDVERGYAHFRTYVRDVLGNEATMYGSETAKDFGDFAEKASTKSLGRALMALGYSTDGANDFDEGDKPVDAPQQQRQAAPRPATARPQQAASQAQATRPAPQRAETSSAALTSPAPTTNVTAMDAARASELAQRDIANKLRDAGYNTLEKVEGFLEEHLGVDRVGDHIDPMKLKGGTSEITVGEVRTLIAALSAANQRRAAAAPSPIPEGAL